MNTICYCSHDMKFGFFLILRIDRHIDAQMVVQVRLVMYIPETHGEAPGSNTEAKAKAEW